MRFESIQDFCEHCGMFSDDPNGLLNDSENWNPEEILTLLEREYLVAIQNGRDPLSDDFYNDVYMQPFVFWLTDSGFTLPPQDIVDCGNVTAFGDFLTEASNQVREAITSDKTMSQLESAMQNDDTESMIRTLKEEILDKIMHGYNEHLGGLTILGMIYNVIREIRWASEGWAPSKHVVGTVLDILESEDRPVMLGGNADELAMIRSLDQMYNSIGTTDE